MRPKLLASWSLVLLAPWTAGADLERRAHEIPGISASPDLEEHHCGHWPSVGELRLPDSGRPVAFTEDSEAPWTYSGAPPLAEDLSRVIREHIAPEAWEREGASVEADGKRLLVTAEPEVHEHIRSFLEALRNHSRVQVDVALVPNDSLPEGAGPGSTLFAAAFGEAVERGAGRSARVTLACRNGETARSFAGTRRAALSREEVKQTGYVPVTEPQIEETPLGITVEAQALRIPEDLGIRVRFHVTRLRPAGKARLLETPFATLTLEPLGEESAEGVVVVPPESTVVAATLRLAGLEGPQDFSVLVRARPEEAPADRAPAAARDPGVDLHDAAFLLEGLRKPALLLRDHIEELVRTNVIEARSFEGLTVSALEPHIIASGPAEGRGAVRAWLSARNERRARRAHVTVRLIEGPLAAILEAVRGADGPLLRDGWQEAAEAKGASATAALTLSFREGGWSALRSVVAVPFVTDVDAISGGAFGPSGFMPAVRVEPLCTGLHARASLAEITRDRLELDLDLVVTRASPGAGAEILAPADVGEPLARPSRAGDGTFTQASWLWLPYPIELPRLEVMDWEGSIAVRSGRPSLLRAGQVEGGLAWLIAVEARIEGEGGSRSEGGRLEREMQVFDTGFLSRGQHLASRTVPDGPVLDTRRLERDTPILISDPLPLPRPSIENAIHDLLPAEDRDGIRTTEESTHFVVVGPSSVQDRAHRLIEEIESDHARTCRVDTAIVPCSALDAASPGWSAPGASPWIDGGALERALDASGEDAMFLSNVLPPGLLLSLAPPARARAIPHHDVNHTGEFPVLNPVVLWDALGSHAELRTAREAAPALGPLEATIGRSSPSGNPERRRLPAGDVDLQGFRREQVQGVLLTAPGKTVVAGAWIRPASSGGTEPFAALVRVDPGAGEPPRAPPETDVEDIELPAPPEPPRAAVLDVWLASVSAPEAEDLSQRIDPARLQAMERAGSERIRLAGSLGARLALTAVSGRPYVTGKRVWTGHRNPELITVSDFEVNSIGEGVSLDARVKSVPGGLAHISIRGERNGPPRAGRKARVKAVPLPRGDASGKPLAGPPADEWVDIDLPEVEEDRWQNEITVPPGRPVLLRAVPATDGKTRVTIVRVDIHEP